MLFDPYIGNNFQVTIAPVELVGNFSSVSGLGAEMEYDEYSEGGNFTSKVYLPKGMKHSHIVLQRGTVPLEPMAMWFASVQTGVQPRYPMMVTLLDDHTSMPRKIWMIMDVLPVKIDYTPLNAMSNQVSITTLELIHGEIIPFF